jgi:NDP-sugar pyrophosphorylase family protein
MKRRVAANAAPVKALPGKGMPVKAMVLAAGEGVRLRPLTSDRSKCMVEVGGKPVLERNIEWLRRYGVRELVINLHHAADSVTGYFGDGSRFGVRISYSLEPQLLGTAGAVRKVAEQFTGPFFVWYGDNLSTCRLDQLWEFHVASGGLVTIALHEREDPTASGIAGLDERGRITRFLEKPRPHEVFSHWVNAGILVLEPEVIGAIPAGVAADFSRDVFPAMLEQDAAVFGYRMRGEERLWWIDTLADLERVEKQFALV